MPHRTFVGPVERGERNPSAPGLRTPARALRLPPAGRFAGIK